MVSPNSSVHPCGEDHLLTVREVANRLGVSPFTVYRLCERGKLGHIRVSNAIRIAAADVAAFVALARLNDGI